MHLPSRYVLQKTKEPLFIIVLFVFFSFFLCPLHGTADILIVQQEEIQLSKR